MNKIDIWSTKYLFTDGIVKQESLISSNNVVTIFGNMITKPYWHDNEKDAIEHAKVLLDRKIKSTKRLLDKLNNFEIIIRS
jgi:hypothetical protein